MTNDTVFNHTQTGLKVASNRKHLPVQPVLNWDSVGENVNLTKLKGFPVKYNNNMPLYPT